MASLTAVKRIIKAIEECDDIEASLKAAVEPSFRMSEGMRSSLIGAIIERRAALVYQLERLGLIIDEEA